MNSWDSHHVCSRFNAPSTSGRLDFAHIASALPERSSVWITHADEGVYLDSVPEPNQHGARCLRRFSDHKPTGHVRPVMPMSGAV